MENQYTLRSSALVTTRSLHQSTSTWGYLLSDNGGLPNYDFPYFSDELVEIVSYKADPQVFSSEVRPEAFRIRIDNHEADVAAAHVRTTNQATIVGATMTMDDSLEVLKSISSIPIVRAVVTKRRHEDEINDHEASLAAAAMRRAAAAQASDGLGDANQTDEEEENEEEDEMPDDLLYKKGDFIEFLEHVPQHKHLFLGFVRGRALLINKAEVVFYSQEATEPGSHASRPGTFLVRYQSADKPRGFDRMKKLTTSYRAQDSSCDVEFVMIDGTTASPPVRCHSVVLAAFSTFFERLFEERAKVTTKHHHSSSSSSASTTTASSSPLHQIDCRRLGVTSLEAIRTLTDYVYYDDAVIDFSQALGILRLLDRTSAEDTRLRRACVVCLERNLNLRNIGATWRVFRDVEAVNRSCTLWCVKYLSWCLDLNQEFLTNFEETDVFRLLNHPLMSRFTPEVELFEGVWKYVEKRVLANAAAKNSASSASSSSLPSAAGNSATTSNKGEEKEESKTTKREAAVRGKGKRRKEEKRRQEEELENDSHHPDKRLKTAPLPLPPGTTEDVLRRNEAIQTAGRRFFQCIRFWKMNTARLANLKAHHKISDEMYRRSAERLAGLEPSYLLEHPVVCVSCGTATRDPIKLACPSCGRRFPLGALSWEHFFYKERDFDFGGENSDDEDDDDDEDEENRGDDEDEDDEGERDGEDDDGDDDNLNDSGDAEMVEEVEESSESGNEEEEEEEEDRGRKGGGKGKGKGKGR